MPLYKGLELNQQIYRSAGWNRFTWFLDPPLNWLWMCLHILFNGVHVSWPILISWSQHRLVSASYSDTRQITRHICISQYELSYYNTKNICLYVCMLISPQTPATPSVAQQLNVDILIFFIIFMFKVTTLLCVTLHHFTNELVKSNWVYLRTLCKVFNVKHWLIFLMYLMHCKLLQVQVIDMYR